MFWNRTFGHNMIITYNGQDLFIVYGFMYLCTFFHLKTIKFLQNILKTPCSIEAFNIAIYLGKIERCSLILWSSVCFGIGNLGIT